MSQFFSIGPGAKKDIAKIKRVLEKAQSEFPKLWLKTLNDSADIARKHLLINFNSQGGAFGAKWPKLKLATQLDRKRKGFKPTRPILVRRGRLRASIVDKRSAGHRQRITQSGITLASAVTVGGHNLFNIHQKGTRVIPARKMVRDGSPPWVSTRAWNEIRLRMVGMFVELRRAMEKA